MSSKRNPQYTGTPRRSALFLQTSSPYAPTRFHPTLILDFSPDRAIFDQQEQNLLIRIPGQRDMVIQGFFLVGPRGLPDVILRDGSILSGAEFFDRFAPGLNYRTISQDKENPCSTCELADEDLPTEQGHSFSRKLDQHTLLTGSMPPPIVARFVMYVDAGLLGGDIPISGVSGNLGAGVPAFAGSLNKCNIPSELEYGVARLHYDGSVYFTLDPNCEELLREHGTLTDHIFYHDIEGEEHCIQIILTTSKTGIPETFQQSTTHPVLFSLDHEETWHRH